jgi:UDP-N-acetyl-2-amino-2-deoxyglucuronate dehydrogenase
MAKVRLGIIGIGRMGKVHAFNVAHHAIPGLSLAAVCDIDPSALSWCHKHARHAHPYADYREMVEKEKLDGVLIVTPHYSHPEIAEYLLNHKQNTLIEKPLAVSIQSASEVLEASKANPSVICGVSFNQRSNKVYQKAKAILASGKLGTLRSASYEITNWYRSDAYYRANPWRGSYSQEGGGCLINQCVHQLDLLNWLLGLPEKVEAKSQTIDRSISAENEASAILSYPTFDLYFHASSHELKGINRLEIFGDKGSLRISEHRLVAYFHDDEKAVNARTTKGYGHAHSSRRVYGYGFFRLLWDLTHGQQVHSLAAFRDAIRGKKPLLATLEEGYRATELLNAIYLSSWEKKAVSLPVDEKVYETALKQKCQEEKA